MTFRRKLLTVFALTVFLSVAAVALLVLAVTRNAFEKTEEQRTAALVTQFQREFTRSQALSRSTEWRPCSTARPPILPSISSWRGKWRRVVSSTFWNFWTGRGKSFPRRSGRRSLAMPTLGLTACRLRAGRVHF